MKLHVGCAMWTHAAWQGRYLPHPLPPGERLRAYASWVNAVEGNTTFYATPSSTTVESWAQQTAPDFRLLLKLPRPITHERRLADTDDLVSAFLTRMEPLGSRAALWVQLPPSFGPADLGALAAFLGRLPRRSWSAVEVRHPAFFEDSRHQRRLEEVLYPFGAEWVTFDTTALFATPPTTDAEREAWTKKPRLPRQPQALTAHPIIRYIGRDDPTRTTESWQPLLETVTTWLQEGRSPTVFIHTPDNHEALPLARQFHEAVRVRFPELEPLPEPVPTGPPTLF